MLVGIRNALPRRFYGIEKPGGLPFETQNRTRPRQESIAPALRKLTRIYRYYRILDVDLKLTDLDKGEVHGQSNSTILGCRYCDTGVPNGSVGLRDAKVCAIADAGA